MRYPQNSIAIIDRYLAAYGCDGCIFISHFLERSSEIQILNSDNKFILQIICYLYLNNKELYNNIKSRSDINLKEYLKSLEEDFKDDYMYETICNSIEK